jgi:hypothetical protein
VRKHNDHRKGFWGMAVLIAMIAFFACSFITNHEKHGEYAVHSIPGSGIQTNAPAINDVQLFFYQKSLHTFVVNWQFNAVNDYYKLLFENRLINQRIATLVKSEILIKPGLPKPFHFLYHYPDPDIPPVLS